MFIRLQNIVNDIKQCPCCLLFQCNLLSSLSLIENIIPLIMTTIHLISLRIALLYHKYHLVSCPALPLHKPQNDMQGLGGSTVWTKLISLLSLLIINFDQRRPDESLLSFFQITAVHFALNKLAFRMGAGKVWPSKCKGWNQSITVGVRTFIFFPQR